jgi:hypothetical protein
VCLQRLDGLGLIGYWSAFNLVCQNQAVGMLDQCPSSVFQYDLISRHIQHVKLFLRLRYIGGPVTHLYESLTGNNWNVHGESKYCCFSIYENVGGDGNWKPLVVNERLYDATTTAKSSDKNATFTWA